MRFSKRLMLIGVADLLVLASSIIIGLMTASISLYNVFGFHPQFTVEWLAFVAVILTSLVSTGLYNPNYMFDMREAVTRLITGFIAAFILVSLLLTIFGAAPALKTALPPAMALSFAGLLVIRFLASRERAARYFKRRVLVLGAGARARRIANEVGNRRGHGGFIPVAYVRTGTADPKVGQHLVISVPDDLSRYCDEEQIDEIVVAADERRGALPIEALLDCRMSGRRVIEVTNFLEREAGQVELEGLYPSWLLYSGGSKRNQIGAAAKRMFDVAASSVLLLVTLPVTVVTAICILIDDGWPIFYRQTRVGLHDKPFDVVKFRSMKKDAEKDGVARWAQKDDDRVTRVGQFIRQTRIDEIPQIYNVLRGEMSFVGPRPERPSIVSDLEEQIPFFKYRHFVKPGITGWAQVNYSYGASIEDARQKLKYDLYYVKNGSLLVDFLILMETVRVVAWPEGVR